MGIKRPLIILGSTVSAVAAVLSYHPTASGSSALLAQTPDSGSDLVDSSSVASSSTPSPSTPAATAPASAAPEPSATAAATKKAAPSKSTSVKKKSSESSSSANATAEPSTTDSTSAEPTPSASTSPSASGKVVKDQTVTGATAQTRWGPVQVQITVKDGKIVDAVGLQYPNGDRRSLWISEQAIPWLVEATLAEQIADVQIIGGATYTTLGWRQSLASAMQKAGL